MTWTVTEPAYIAAVENGPLTAVQFCPVESGELGADFMRRWVASPGGRLSSGLSCGAPLLLREVTHLHPFLNFCPLLIFLKATRCARWAAPSPVVSSALTLLRRL